MQRGESEEQAMERLRNMTKQQHAGEMGISETEFASRVSEANSPRTVETSSGRRFSIQSFARSKQIMSKGVLALQRQKKEQDYDKLYIKVRKTGWIACGVAIMGVAYCYMHFIAPSKAVLQSIPNRRMRRYEEVHLPSLRRKLEEEGLNPADFGVPPPKKA
jgi:hypothetical protein